MNKKILILVVVLIILIIITTIMSLFWKKEKRENMKILEFPKQVKHQTLNAEEKQDISKLVSKKPDKIEFKVYETPIFKDKKLIVKSELTNYGEDFDLFVSPVGGEFPYGGTNPFYITFSSSARDSVKYIGPTFPPEPPLPMKIFVPSNSQIIFYGEIPLDLYEWEGEPEILIDWYFLRYFEESYPKGTLKVVLPKK